MNEPKICIIGAGNLSSRRIYPYIGTAGGQLAGVCDMNTEKAKKNARLFGGRAYSNYNEMLEVEKPQINIAARIILVPGSPGTKAPTTPIAIKNTTTPYKIVMNSALSD